MAELWWAFPAATPAGLHKCVFIILERSSVLPVFLSVNDLRMCLLSVLLNLPPLRGRFRDEQVFPKN